MDNQNRTHLTRYVLAVTPGFVGVVDRDVVDVGNDFATVALNTYHLGSLRGKGCEINILETAAVILPIPISEPLSR